MADQATSVQVRTLDGQVWVNARDLTQRLREIAAENRAAAEAYGDPFPSTTPPWSGSTPQRSASKRPPTG